MVNWSEVQIWVMVVTIKVESKGQITETFERKHPMALSEKSDITSKKKKRRRSKLTLRY